MVSTIDISLPRGSFMAPHLEQSDKASISIHLHRLNPLDSHLERLKQDCGVRIVSPLSLSPTGLHDAVAIFRDCALFLASAGLSGNFLQ